MKGHDDMRWSLERKVIAGLLAGLCILMVVGVLAYRSTVQFLQVTERRAQTHLVLEKLENLLAHITDTETGVRGYIVTGKKRFLEPYQNALAVLTEERIELRRLLGEIPEQKEQFDALEEVIAQYLVLARQQIELRHNRAFDESLEELYMDAETGFMDHIRMRSHTMKQAASARVFEQDREVLAGSRRTMAAIMVGSVLACGIVILAIAIVKRDLLVRRRTELERLETQSLLNAIVEHIPAMIFVKDAQEHRFVRLNKAGEDLLGYSKQDLLGKSDYDLFSKEEADFFVAKDREVFTGGRMVTIPEEPIQTKYKGCRILHTKKVPIFGEDGAPQYVLGISEDITDKKRADVALRESEERFHLAVQGASTGIWDWDVRTDTVHLSPLWKSMLGYDVHEIGDDYAEWESRLHPDDRARTASAIQASLDEPGVNLELEYRLRHKNGSYRWILARGIAMRDDHGIAYRMAGSHVDITRRAEAEEAWKLSQAFARNIIASSLDMIIVVDKDRRILEFNRAAEDAFGYRPDEVLGHPMDVLYSECRIGEHIYTTAMQQGRYVHELLNRRKDGTEFVSLLSASVLRDGAGEILGVMSVSRDITEQKHAVTELRKAKEAAEAANQAKTEFLASMSHEIRTPMNAIIGMADLLWDTPLMPEQQEYVGIFRRAGLSLLNLLNDILDLSKVEAGYLELERIEFDLHEVIDKTSEMMALRAHEKNLELGCSVAPEAAIALIGDPNRLKQVLLNLIGNAIKFTEQGTVALRVIQDPDVKESGALRFMVSDTGIGIPAGKIESVFERFVQADSSTTRKYGGTGLGLTISKRLVELMGGHIRVESTEGKGSTFSFTARFTPQICSPHHHAVPQINLAGVKTLIADDNATNRMILNEALASWGAHVTEATDGESALRELQKNQATQPYQLVLLDCRMPDLGGFDVIQRFMETSRLDGMTVMVLTSDSRSADIAKSYKLGLGGYLLKPIRRSDLHKAIAIAMNRPKGLGSTASVAHAGLRTDPSLKILLVEDSPDNALLIRSYLKRETCELDHAVNGQVALERFQTGRYDLVLMDMHMPVMDGYTAAAHMRQWEGQHGREPVPIVALTAFGMKHEEQRSLRAGCTAHLVKPIRKATLLAAIDKYARSVT
jgi:two-component system, sensor histidine kinase and response regulator